MEPTVLEGIKPESLELEWLAEYNDGSTLHQRYEQTGEKTFGDIDQSKLKQFWLVDSTGDKHFGIDIEKQSILIGDVPFIVEFPRNKAGEVMTGKLVYFRRIRNDFAPEGTVTTVRYAIGFQANIDGRNVQQYLFVNMDGTFTLSQQK